VAAAGQYVMFAQISICILPHIVSVLKRISYAAHSELYIYVPVCACVP